MQTVTASGVGLSKHIVASTVGAVAVSAFLPGINFSILLAAFFGALVFTMSAKELGTLERLVYLPISTFVGYIAASEVEERLHLLSPALAAFFGGALAITSILRMISFVQTCNIFDVFKQK